MTLQNGYRVPNWLVALAGAVVFLIGVGVAGGRQLAHVEAQHEFLIYETCRVERHLGMVTPQQCESGNHTQGEGQ